MRHPVATMTLTASGSEARAGRTFRIYDGGAWKDFLKIL